MHEATFTSDTPQYNMQSLFTSFNYKSFPVCFIFIYLLHFSSLLNSTGTTNIPFSDALQLPRQMLCHVNEEILCFPFASLQLPLQAPASRSAACCWLISPGLRWSAAFHLGVNQSEVGTEEVLGLAFLFYHQSSTSHLTIIGTPV